MGYNEEEKELDITLADLMNNAISDNEIQTNKSILHHKENIDLIPSNLDLSTMDIVLLKALDRENILNKCIESIKPNYDYILVDCMPSLSLLTVNALSCADKVIIPVQAQYLAARGMGQLIKSISKVKRNVNPKLEIEGILLTLVDKRTRLSKEVRETIKDSYGQFINVFETEIPFATKTAEATKNAKSVFTYDKNGKVAEAYSNLAEEVLSFERERKRNATSKDFCR